MQSSDAICRDRVAAAAQGDAPAAVPVVRIVVEAAQTFDSTGNERSAAIGARADVVLRDGVVGRAAVDVNGAAKCPGDRVVADDIVAGQDVDAAGGKASGLSRRAQLDRLSIGAQPHPKLFDEVAVLLECQRAAVEETQVADHVVFALDLQREVARCNQDYGADSAPARLRRTVDGYLAIQVQN